jgi:hypothetical protein
MFKSLMGKNSRKIYVDGKHRVINFFSKKIKSLHYDFKYLLNTIANCKFFITQYSSDDEPDILYSK